MFFLKDQNCFIHLKTDKPCSILMRLSLLFNFFKHFFNVLLFWNSKWASTLQGDGALKHTRDVNIINVIPAESFFQKRQPSCSCNFQSTMRCHNLIKTTGQWFSFKECSEHALKRNKLTSYNYNTAFVCFCFHLIFRASIYC